MENLSNELLIQAYFESIRHGLDEEFQILLKEEISRRKLDINYAVQSGLHKSNLTIQYFNEQTGENIIIGFSRTK